VTLWLGYGCLTWFSFGFMALGGLGSSFGFMAWVWLLDLARLWLYGFGWAWIQLWLYGLGMALAVAELLSFGTISRGSKMVDDCCVNL